MSVADRLAWVARGSPFRLMTPAAALRDILRSHGYTVYDIGNKQHLEAEPPEDHTPYSETGYPGQAQYGVGYAIDIMPPAAGARSKIDNLPLPTLAQIGALLLADRRLGVSGISWLKYMNWEPGDGNCWHESWQPNYARRASTDRGHIHLSGLTGFENSTVGAGYDPVARIRGVDMYDQEQADRLWATTNRTLATLSNAPAARYSIGGQERVEANGLAAAIAELKVLLLNLSTRDWVDEQQIIDGVVAGLGRLPVEEAAAALRAVYQDRPEDLRRLGQLLSAPAT